MRIAQLVLNWSLVFLLSLLAFTALRGCWGILLSRWSRLRFRRRILHVLVLVIPAVIIGQFLAGQFFRHIGYFSRVEVPSFVQERGTLLTEPHLAFSGRVLYRIVHPQRGSIVTVLSEEKAGIDRWGSTDIGVELRYVADEKGRSYIRRVLGLPGESLEIVGGHVHVDGQELVEEYVKHFGACPDSLAVRLRHGEFLVARDVRTTQALSAEHTFVVVHISQVMGRELFVLWPPNLVGFVRAARYNISDPPVLRIRLSEHLVHALTNM